jgi:hypothetical protein
MQFLKEAPKLISVVSDYVQVFQKEFGDSSYSLLNKDNSRKQLG